MRKTILFAVVMLLSVSLSAQHRYQQREQHRRSPSFMGWYLAKEEPEALIKRNELKLNLPTTIFMLHPEITYERILSEDFGVGASLGFNPGSDEYPINFMLAPFARWYFGGNSVSMQKYGAGLFIELNGGLFSTDDSYYESFGGDGVFHSENVFGAGLGMAFGWKYLTVNNWIAEVYFGAGRDFINDDAYPRMGITIGKRF